MQKASRFSGWRIPHGNYSIAWIWRKAKCTWISERHRVLMSCRQWDWQNWTDSKPVNAPLKPWHKSLDLEVANQVKHLKSLVLGRPYFERIPDQSLIVGEQQDDETYVSATRDKSGSYGLFYFPDGKTISIDLKNLSGETFKVIWFDPRTGVEFPGNGGHPLPKGTNLPINPPSSGRGNDWVLIIERIN